MSKEDKKKASLVVIRYRDIKVVWLDMCNRDGKKKNLVKPVVLFKYIHHSLLTSHRLLLVRISYIPRYD